MGSVHRRGNYEKPFFFILTKETLRKRNKNIPAAVGEKKEGKNEASSKKGKFIVIANPIV